MTDSAIAACSERAVRCAASRWQVPIGGAGFNIPVQDQAALETAAATRGMTAAALGGLILALAIRDGLVDAILDEEPRQPIG